jgi:bacteriocin-like protein
MTHIQMTDGNSSDLGLSEELANEELTDEELSAIDGGLIGGGISRDGVAFSTLFGGGERIDWRFEVPRWGN